MGAKNRVYTVYTHKSMYSIPHTLLFVKPIFQKGVYFFMPKIKYKKRADGRYIKQIKIGYQDNGKPKLKNIYAKTVQELEAKVAEFKSQYIKGIIVDDKNLTLGQWAEQWITAYKKRCKL